MIMHSRDRTYVVVGWEGNQIFLRDVRPIGTRRLLIFSFERNGWEIRNGTTLYESSAPRCDLF